MEVQTAANTKQQFPGIITNNLEKLVKRWREKVYECLMTNKRYEVTIK